eukprot:CAMPEP_0176267756 /NCGR_PEP_ID=MMETSP0121_2-20121125/43321_1 /TAXON_ID=160619 /ORGANISM="Kryptoperidinium foliaceum, Strain CCMP 1326" /LENGTH=68 /DNA_ID=CAMNT_0017607825 /DNA_START=161 /DNA_END=363 /DNA_ORIENTATION=+
MTGAELGTLRMSTGATLAALHTEFEKSLGHECLRPDGSETRLALVLPSGVALQDLDARLSELLASVLA